MKIQKITAALLLAIAVLFTSCEKWIDTDLNIDPDSPIDVPLRMLLPSIQARMAYDLCGNDVVLPTHVWLQYFNGYARQAQVFAQYKYTPADVNNLWDGIYAGSGMDLKVLMDKATLSGATLSKGVGEILTAYLFAVTTDLYGDIPYTEAFQGSDNMTPKVDNQQSIYASIDLLLDSAIIHLGQDDIFGIEGDMMFGGDPDAWIKTAYALKARNAMNLSLVNANAATEALAALANAYESNADNFAFNFGTKPTEQSPITQFVDQRGDIVMGSFFMDMMLAVSDPRVEMYADLSDLGTYAGSTPTEDNTEGISFPGDYISNKSGDEGVTSYFMTYSECKFIEAEALLGTDPDAAAAAYKEGVVASLMQVLGDTTGLTGWFETYIGNETGATLTLEDIINQKYIANYGQMQPYNDYRRTGFPSGLVNPPDLSVTSIPLRYPYSQDEITYNPYIEDLWQKTVFINTPVWWDVN